jgi:hypothetical protein
MPFTALMQFEVKPLIQVDYDTSLKQLAEVIGKG